MNHENPRTAGKLGAKSKFAGINTVLPAVVNDLGLDRRMQEQALFSLWASFLEPNYASRSKPLYIDSQGILVVAVENGSTAQELSFLKAKLLAQLQPIGSELGLSIKGMRFDLKRFAQTLDSEELAITVKNEITSEVTPTQAELSAFELSADEIEEISGLKQKLEAMGEKLHFGQKIEGSTTQMLDRIIRLVEKKLRLKKWSIQQNMPVCEQCAEPLPQSGRQLNIMHCPYCRCAGK